MLDFEYCDFIKKTLMRMIGSDDLMLVYYTHSILDGTTYGFDDTSIFLFNAGKFIFEYSLRTHSLSVSEENIWCILSTCFNLTTPEIRVFLQKEIKETFNFETESCQIWRFPNSLVKYIEYDFKNKPNLFKMIKPCKDCPIHPLTTAAEQAVNYGCLPVLSETIDWFNKSGRIWACHADNKQPCAGVLKKLIQNKETIDFKKELITEETNFENGYPI